MATKPTSLPEWASSPAPGDLVEPSTGKKQAGWIVEAPPHETFNWWQNLVYQWLVWLDALLGDAHTWTALQTFTAGIVTNILTVTGALQALDVVPDSAGANSGTMTGSLRLGSTTSGEGVISKRTSGGNQFGLDLMTAGASRVAISNAGVVTVPGSLKPNSGLDLSSAPTPATVTNSKTVNARNVVRGMARIQHSAAYGSSTAAATYNCTLSGTDGSTYTVTIDLNEDMGTNLFVQVTDFDTSGGSNNYVTRVKSVAVTGGKTRITLNTTVNGANTAIGNTNCGFYMTVWSMN